MSGITPYPLGDPDDHRLPHIAAKIHKDIHKTALGAEETVLWKYHPSTAHIIKELKAYGWYVCALEQSPNAHDLITFQKEPKVALVVGNEVDGLSPEVLKLCDDILEIEMIGKKESFNVSVAGAMALFWLKNR